MFNLLSARALSETFDWLYDLGQPESGKSNVMLNLDLHVARMDYVGRLIGLGTVTVGRDWDTHSLPLELPGSGAKSGSGRPQKIRLVQESGPPQKQFEFTETDSHPAFLEFTWPDVRFNVPYAGSLEKVQKRRYGRGETARWANLLDAHLRQAYIETADAMFKRSLKDIWSVGLGLGCAALAGAEISEPEATAKWALLYVTLHMLRAGVGYRKESKRLRSIGGKSEEHDNNEEGPVPKWRPGLLPGGLRPERWVAARLLLALPGYRLVSVARKTPSPPAGLTKQQ